MPNHANATREQIIAALKAGHSTAQIARDLHIDKARARTIRNELGIPPFVRGSDQPTLEERWQRHAKPADGGHMEWTGERSPSGRPLISHRYRHRSAAAVSFRIRTGRDPVGHALADCGMRHCVAPEHVEDMPGRRRNREQLRYLSGGGALPEECAAGHAQSEHGRVGTDGRAYCETCKRARAKSTERAA